MTNLTHAAYLLRQAARKERLHAEAIIKRTSGKDGWSDAVKDMHLLAAEYVAAADAIDPPVEATP